MIKNLEWVTKDGNKMKLKNSPIDLGVDMLLMSCNKDEKIKIFNDLKAELDPKPTDLVSRFTEPKTCSKCCYVHHPELNECPQCGNKNIEEDHF